MAAGAALGLLVPAVGPAGANVPAGEGLGELFPVDCPDLGGPVRVLSKENSDAQPTTLRETGPS